MGENFQFFSGSSRRLRNRLSCSSFETWRKNLRITVPLRVRYFSKFRMSSNRSSQIFLVTSSGGSFWAARNDGLTGPPASPRSRNG